MTSNLPHSPAALPFDTADTSIWQGAHAVQAHVVLDHAGHQGSIPVWSASPLSHRPWGPGAMASYAENAGFYLPQKNKGVNDQR